MKRYRVSKEAEKDLDEIFAYWGERASLDIADRLIDAIVERFWLLGEFPESGRASTVSAIGAAFGRGRRANDAIPYVGDSGIPNQGYKRFSLSHVCIGSATRTARRDARRAPAQHQEGKP